MARTVCVVNASLKYRAQRYLGMIVFGLLRTQVVL